MPQIPADDSSGFERRFDECNALCAVRQRINADCSRTRANISEMRPFDSRREDVEQRLAQTIRGRAHAPSFERFQPAAFVDSSDHSHRWWLVVGGWWLSSVRPTTNH